MAYKIEERPGGARFLLQEDFSLERTLQSGQCFRWQRTAEGFAGAAGGFAARLLQPQPAVIELYVQGPSPAWWAEYLDLNRDYPAIRARLCTDPHLADAFAAAEGIHILRQQPWEALASFILSQNNNIPRIRGIIARLCESFGQPLDRGLFAFPGPETLAPLSVEALAPLRAGFRAKYLLDAARRVVSGALDLAAVAALPTEEARARLMEIYGVGRKVADCTLLYGFARVEVCPVDVWMKRALAACETGALPACALPYAGIAQQVLFEYTRNSK